ncbi:MAG TPA: SDR family NAD(P)-dependent oxidoreductase [Synergistaceae bacterium]|jgi:nucleoside-diphosphate-sugar epimerase|nr:SDR family NAD(P)-dependent oxidoreductase [Synergistaceae bacterium]NLL40850.1 SDR family NAD(P)-dependent oxidoreductase [Synergistaceae bacterium]HQA55408.1 SDR family NAD(P)-dependent oxidoreductase [Synergistaceae bacterium]
MKPARSALVTGGAGFIGSHMADELIENGWEVTVLDNLETGKRENLEHLRDDPRLTFVEGDVSDREILKDLLEGKDAVFHFAAMVSVPLSIKMPEKCHRNNITAFSDLIIAMKDMDIPLIYASSAAVYGNRDEGLRREDENPLPMSPYGASKAINEIQAACAARVWDLDTVGFRFFNVYGPRQDPFGPYASVIPRFCHALSTGRRPVVYGDGDQTRDFVYVRDLTSILIKMCEKAHINRGRVFNLGTGKSMSVNELLKLISAIMGSSAAEERLPERAGDIKMSCADMTLLTEAIGRPVFTDIGTALSATAKWYRDNCKS